MNRRYYAAELKGNDEVRAIENVFSFESFSQRVQWLTEKSKNVRTSLSSKIAKKHIPIEVTFRSAIRGGSLAWTWMYNNIPEWLVFQ